MGCCANSSEDRGLSTRHNVTSANDSVSDLELISALNDVNAGLKQKVLLNIKCNKLPNLDKDSKSDPFCVLW